jgi:hypothetical protein
MVEVLDRVQQQGERVTGVAPHGSDLRVASVSTFCGQIRQAEEFSGCSGRRGRAKEEREGRWLTGSIAIDETRR